MSYIERIEDSKKKVYNQAVAQRILDLIDKLRLTSNDNDGRRWVWELMQNAKDVAFDGQPVSVEINFYENKHNPIVEFKHNGAPFSIDNITFLIEQVSTKDREAINGKKPKTTGKFGTGFLTTHLLSEEVEIEGVVKEDKLPFKKFELLLDRRGTSLREIIDSVNQSLQLLSKLDEQDPHTDYDPEQFNTCFRYTLDDIGKSIAMQGMSDLEVSLPYTLAFIPSIRSVHINGKVRYRLLTEIVALNELVEIYTLSEESAGEVKESNIVVIGSERVQIAVPIIYEVDKITLIEPDKHLPKLFCDFPLIGSEDFGSPVVINSPLFNPTEQRNGIFLSDKSDHKIVENKILIEEAKNLYFKLLEFAAHNNWENMYVLADIKLPKTKDWISNEWMKEAFLSPIRKKLLTTPIIDTVNYGRIPIECGNHLNMPENARVDFPKHSNADVLTKLWMLCDTPYFILPVEKDYRKWAKIIWDEDYSVNLKTLVTIVESKKNLFELSRSLSKKENETLNWLNDLYSLLVEEGEVIKDIQNKCIYPNQKGSFRKKEDLFFQMEEIDDLLKDVIEDLGEDVRNKLLNQSIQIDLPQTNNYSSSDIATRITTLIKPRFAEIVNSEDDRKIFRKLYVWFGQNKELAKTIFEDLYRNKHKLLDDHEIVTSIKKAEAYDMLLHEEPLLSVERIRQLLEIENLSKGFLIDKQYTPDELQKIRNFENGWKGEAFVFKMLLSKGINVSWPNKSLIHTTNKIVDFEGESHYINDMCQRYDLVVSTPDNQKYFIQVKSTTTDISRADEIAMPISVREWKFINDKTATDSYYLARVFNVNSTPEVYFMKVESTISNN